jgi:protein-export membrane protein SecD
MGKTGRWKLVIIAGVIMWAVWSLIPQFRLVLMSEEEEAANPELVEKLKTRSLALGLDLRGGMRLVLDVDTSELPPDQVKDPSDARDRALEVIRNRVDQFGVTEPSITPQGDTRIVVSLPGLSDETRAKRLIGQTALLEFQAVVPMEETQGILLAIDEQLKTEAAEEDTTVSETEKAEEDTTDQLFEDLTPESPTADDEENPFLGKFIRVMGAPGVREGDVDWLKNTLAREDVMDLIPKDERGRPKYEFLLHREPKEFERMGGRAVYLVERKPIITGAQIVKAGARPGLDENNPAAFGVSVTLNKKGGRVFEEYTGAHIGDYLAIVLDEKVYSAPVIRTKIPRGQVAITGNFSDQEAMDLAIVLRAGALPAPVNIIEERTIGPSLGADSIRMGLTAALIGLGVVVVFMVFYYRFSGVIANLALALNLLFLFGALVTLGATLTLPGIAGIILTIGMAVDANVLIFERIREEIRNKKTVKTAVDTGYAKAFLTILDANVTTLITALILLYYGTGPVKGFAVTLSIGIVASMFTALIITRAAFDYLTERRRVKALSI